MAQQTHYTLYKVSLQYKLSTSDGMGMRLQALTSDGLGMRLQALHNSWSGNETTVAKPTVKTYQLVCDPCQTPHI